MATDYRELNKNLKPATHPLPNIRDCVETLAGRTIFSALDVKSASIKLNFAKKQKVWLIFEVCWHFHTHVIFKIFFVNMKKVFSGVKNYILNKKYGVKIFLAN